MFLKKTERLCVQAGQERLFLNITANRAKQAENTAKGIAIS
jgi:hypothetical protein